jgi:hypothetical protein
MKRFRLLFVAGSALLLALSAVPGTSAATAQESSSGHGALDDGARQFSFSAQRHADGTVTGHATLTNSAFTGENGQSPYQLQVDISCMNVIGNIAFFGGTTQRTNDPSLVDAVFWSVEDNGEPGRNNDEISRVFFWDDDPNTTGDPQACMSNVVDDFPMEPIESGNIQVRPATS